MVVDSVTLSDQQIRTFAYLVPAAVLAAVVRTLVRRYAAFTLLSFAGTFVHEALHLVVGALLGAKPASMNLFPRRQPNGLIEMGSVTFENLRWFNAMPAALAPFLALPLTLWVAKIRATPEWHFEPIDLAIWAGLAPQLFACWPSRADWRLSLISWPLYLAGIAVIWFEIVRP